jgi:hypothetical protein
MAPRFRRFSMPRVLLALEEHRNLSDLYRSKQSPSDRKRKPELLQRSLVEQGPNRTNIPHLI